MRGVGGDHEDRLALEQRAEEDGEVAVRGNQLGQRCLHVDARGAAQKEGMTMNSTAASMTAFLAESGLDGIRFRLIVAIISATSTSPAPP